MPRRRTSKDRNAASADRAGRFVGVMDSFSGLLPSDRVVLARLLVERREMKAAEDAALREEAERDAEIAALKAELARRMRP